MKEAVIPRKTIYRLSVYHRCLEQLRSEENHGSISSEALARVAGVKPTQLRKDLAHFGQLGKRGIGYHSETLRRRLSELLGSTKLHPVVLVGVGNLGSALLGYQGFAKEGFEIVAAFDSDPKKQGKVHDRWTIHPMDQLASITKKHQAKVAILSVPGPAAQKACNDLLDAGIQAILNFAPMILQVPTHIMVNNVNLAIELENLSYFIR